MDCFCRDELREQHQLSQEIASAITNNPLGEQPDEDELEAELEGLEQEAMDERMLKTGTVPVSDQLNRLPAAANGERELTLIATAHTCYLFDVKLTVSLSSQRKDKASRGGRRGGGTRETSCRNGHGLNHPPCIPHSHTVPQPTTIYLRNHLLVTHSPTAVLLSKFS